jgi:hypothetical protein
LPSRIDKDRLIVGEEWLEATSIGWLMQWKQAKNHGSINTFCL